MYDWAGFLPEPFKRLTLLLTYHQMRFTSDGKVTCKKYIGDDERFVCTLIKQQPPANLLLTVIDPPGLDLQWQWYLYEAIGKFCKQECQDEVCPKPAVPKPVKAQSTADPPEPPTALPTASGKLKGRKRALNQ
jgi:hypothetical protein